MPKMQASESYCCEGVGGCAAAVGDEARCVTTAVVQYIKKKLDKNQHAAPFLAAYIK